MHVRRLSSGDHATWLELWDGYLRFYREPLSDEVTEATFARLVEGSDGF